MPPLSFNQCTDLLPYGRPSHTLRYYTPICRYAYVLEYSNRLKTPIWTAHILRPSYTVGCVRRSDSFEVDRSLPKEYQSSPADYEYSDFDMGHMVSSADMSWDDLVEKETFIMSNIAPQLPGFNRGIWKSLEDRTRAWAQERKHVLLIYTGPIYSVRNVLSIGKGVYVPTGFYKIIVDTETKEVMAFQFMHTPIRADLSHFMTRVTDLQKVTGIKFPLPSGYIESSELWRSKLKSTKIAKSLLCVTIR